MEMASADEAVVVAAAVLSLAGDGEVVGDWLSFVGWMMMVLVVAAVRPVGLLGGGGGVGG